MNLKILAFTYFKCPFSPLYGQNIGIKYAEDNASRENLCADEAKESETAEKATEPDDLSNKDIEQVEVIVEDLKDEVCPDHIYTHEPKQLKLNQ